MSKGRMEAFSDGVIAILITIMVLELRVPGGADLAALLPLAPIFLSYVLSFVFLGIYWNNHHHLLQTAKHVSGAILWANLHLLFWLSLFPFTTAWMGENHVAPMPAAVYGFVLLMAAVAYYTLQWALIAQQGGNSLLKSALGRDWKGKLSIVLYLGALPVTFLRPWLGIAVYVFVALMWLVPNRRIERALAKHETRA